MTEVSLTGAQSAATNFYDTLNRLYKSPNASALPPLFTEACTACLAFQKDFETAIQKQTHYTGDVIEYSGVSVTSLVGSNAQVIAKVSQRPVQQVGSDGTVITTVKITHDEISLRLNYQAYWKITSLKVVA